MPNGDDVVHVQVTFALAERVYRWAISQAQKSCVETGRSVDHTIAVLVAAHKEAKVVEVHTKAA